MEMKCIKKRAIIHKFTFSKTGRYCGRASYSLNNITGEYWCKSVLVNLLSMRTARNTGKSGGYSPIENDEDAAARVQYTIDHEWLHVAMHNCQHHVGIEQERMIYKMIGNGGNEYFNEYYDIPIQEEVERLTKGE